MTQTKGMPNNAGVMEEMSDSEIIKVLDGPTAVARMLGIKPPSVQGWLETGIPEVRLIQLAAELERRAPDRFSRLRRWPEKYAFYWPELAARAAANV